MKIRNLLYVLLCMVFAVACVETDINNGEEEGNEGGNEVVKPVEPSDPAYIKFDNNIVVADYDGGVRSVSVDVNAEWEWQISVAASAEEWISAERVDNNLVITLSECADKLEREGVVTVKVGKDDNTAEASVRVLQIGTDTEELIYEVVATGSNHKIVAAPILTSSNGGKMVVDWGDGSELEAYESSRGVHYYAEPGLYTIIITGEDIHNLEFGSGSQVHYELKRVLSWGKMGYKNAANMCKGCINLESIPADVAGSFENVGSFIAAFLGCESLKEIPEGLFRHAVKAKKFSNCFRYTTSISEIPENLFANSPLAEEFYYTFYGTGCDFAITDEALKINSGNYKNSYPAELEQPIEDGNLRSIPEGLFAHNPNITRFEYIFGATAITSIPEKIFAENSAATNYEGVCYACTNLASIPAKLMEKATSATNIKKLSAFYSLFFVFYYLCDNKGLNL